MVSRHRAYGPFVLVVLGSALLSGCLGPSDSDRIGEVREALVLHIEGKDTNALVRHVPDDWGELTISMESGGYVIEPGSIDELEEALWEFTAAFNGERIELTQENIEIMGDRARSNLTFRVHDQGWSRTVPVRMDFERRDEHRWVLTGLHSFE